MEIVRCLRIIDEPDRHRRNMTHWVWTTPSTTHIKVNVDDFFLSASSKRGIGGILNDLEGMILLQLGREVRTDSEVHAELLAICEGLLVDAASLGIFTCFHFRIGLKVGCYMFQGSFDWVEYFCWSPCHIGRMGNIAADTIGKIGLSGINFIKFI